MYSVMHIANLYNDIYATLSHSETFKNILKESQAEEYAGDIEQFSFVTRTDMDRMAVNILSSGAEKILDLGCGTGGITLRLSQLTGITAIGIDISHIAISCAQELARKVGVKNLSPSEFVVADFTALPFQASTFNSVVSIDAIQAAQNKVRCAQEIARVLTTHGQFMFTHWFTRESIEDSISHDVFHSALAKEGLIIESIEETDPGLARQKKIYTRIAEERDSLVNEIGRDFVAMLLREAIVIFDSAHVVQRGFVTARKRGTG